jgi:hypothetical protein
VSAIRSGLAMTGLRSGVRGARLNVIVAARPG